MHKVTCRSITAPARQMRPELDGEVMAISKWLTYWRETLFEYGLYALDLANNPPDILATHM